MKEATGELNMTVVTVVAIAAVAAFFYAFVWPAIKANINRNTNCANAICPATCSTGVCTCTYVDETSGSATSKTVQCTNSNTKSGSSY